MDGQNYYCFTCKKDVPASDYVNEMEFDVTYDSLINAGLGSKTSRAKLCRECNEPLGINTTVCVVRAMKPVVS